MRNIVVLIVFISISVEAHLLCIDVLAGRRGCGCCFTSWEDVKQGDDSWLVEALALRWLVRVIGRIDADLSRRNDALRSSR